LKDLRVAVVGVTGAVGQELLAVLEQRGFPVGELVPLASERSSGDTVAYGSKQVSVIPISGDSFKGVDVTFFCAGGDVSRSFALASAESGALTIDNSSAFRMQPEIPLVVPQVNSAAIGDSKLIANPNCSTIQLVMVLHPLSRLWPLKRVVVSSYQSVSGVGSSGIDELLEQTIELVSGRKPKAPRVFPRTIAFNCIPEIGRPDPSGYTEEERKIMLETRKILGLDSLGVTATAVRVPVIRGHSEAVNIEFERDVSVSEAVEILRSFPGIAVYGSCGERRAGEYPTALDADGNYLTHVGRIRKDPSQPNSLDLWIVSDNLLKGAALNAVEIAEAALGLS
jgi:aspartate-semialdehyde dehydrogenase